MSQILERDVIQEALRAMSEKIGAIVLAGGKGSRMKSSVPKQYMEIAGYPVLYYALKAFEDNSAIDEIVLVAGEGDMDYCRCQIVEQYGLKKVKHIVAGGKERYHSVYHGLCALEGAKYVLIHDGARPMVSQEVIAHNIEAVRQHRACITAVPSKDTVKISSRDGIVEQTPDRAAVWLVQTPQSFEYALIKTAYEAFMQSETSCTITDDAMVVETFTNEPVHLVKGDYRNIKVTTPEDMVIIQHFVSEGGNCNNI